MIMSVLYPLKLTIRSYHLTASLFSSAPLSVFELAVVNEVHSILSTESSIEAPLEAIVSFISPNVVNSVIQDHRNVQFGFRFFNWAMRRKRFRGWFSHNIMMETLNERWDCMNSAWNLFEQLRDSRVLIVPQAFNVLISAYKKYGAVEKAIEAFTRMHEFDSRPNTFTYNTVLKMLTEQQVPQLAMAVYMQMIRSSCRPDRSTFNILIDGLCKLGKIRDAIGLFDEMIHRGISPNTLTYTVVLSGHCQARLIDEAYMLYLHMKENGCTPDSITCNSLISGFCGTGRVDEAFEFIDREKFQIGLNAYSCLIDGLFGVGRFDEACGCYNEMVEKKIVPDCILYTIMIKGFSEAGKITEATNFLREMTEKGYVPDTSCYNTVIKGLCDGGLLDDARSLKLEISERSHFPDSTTYTILICGLCKEGLVGEAKLLFEEMEKHGCLPTVMTFNALIHGLCKAGQINEACIFLHKMEMGRNPSLFLRLSQGTVRVTNNEMLLKYLQQLCQTGQLVKAYRLLRELLTSGVTPDVITYNTLINGMFKTDNISGAFKLLNEMQMKGYMPDAVTYGTLIDGLWRANREMDAVRIFEQISQYGQIPDETIFKTFMRCLCRKGRAWHAFALWIEYLNTSFKDHGKEFVSGAQISFRTGCVADAFRSLLEMEFSLKIVDPSVYSNLLIGFCRAGRLDDAFNIFTVLHEYGIDMTQKSYIILVTCLWQDGKPPLATDLMLYGWKKGFISGSSLCSHLVGPLYYRNKKKHALSCSQIKMRS